MGCSAKNEQKKLAKISDSEIHLFIERAKKGGICFVRKRYSKANNEYFDDYDPTKERNYINYYDANNLYGRAMRKPLPYGGFRWISVTDKHIDIVLNKPDNSMHGYFAEVDMYHPDELHDYQNDFPKAPEKIYITEDSLSEDQINTAKKYNIKIGASKKLVPTLYPKKDYVVHYRNLKYYLANGWKLIKVHRILEFKQSPWLKTYTDFNTRKQQEATTKSLKDFFKLMNNSAYGKTIEDKRKRIKLRVVINE